MSERRVRVSQLERKRTIPAARRLSTEEIISHIVPTNQQPTADDNRFVQRDVIGLDIGGVTCLLVDFDNKNLDPRTRDLITSPKTDLVVAEYFGPDLERHGLYDPNNRVARSQKGHHKLRFAQELSDIVQGKPVAVADIASWIQLASATNREKPQMEFAS